MQFVTDPACRMALGVALGSDRAVRRQVRQHLGEAHVSLALEPARLLLLDHLALSGPAALALRWLSTCRSLGRRCLHGLFAGLDCGRIARDVADQAILMGPLDQRLVQAARQLAPRKLRESAREGCFAAKLCGALATPLLTPAS